MLYLYNHGGSGNHGCEAIVRSTVKMFDETCKLYSLNSKQDIQYGIDEICDLQDDVISAYPRKSMKWLLSSIQTKATGKINLAIKFQRANLLSEISDDDICLSIGGDNYCYPGTDVLAALNRNIKKKGAKTVLWGCSVEPVLLQQPAIADDIRSFDLITARESISYEALRSVNTNTVLIPDPAFTLERVDLPLPEGWIEGNMIGINASPLILESGSDSALVLEAYKVLIEKILETTDCSIALIPHVVWKENDDRIPLKKLYNAFSDTNRVILIEDHNCMELKGYIARCRMFIGARTHATIAAYSSCVPTLVLGYSVKSKGIAKDLFGTYENYVLPVQDIVAADELSKGFDWLLKNEDAIRLSLMKKIPDYLNTITQATAKILNMIEMKNVQ